MTLEDLLRRLVPILERLQVALHAHGALSPPAQGMPRSTRDLDIVIAPTQADNLDVAYVGSWVRKLTLDRQWEVVRERG